MHYLAWHAGDQMVFFLLDIVVLFELNYLDIQAISRCAKAILFKIILIANGVDKLCAILSWHANAKIS
jgi:hypothetical protein